MSKTENDDFDFGFSFEDSFDSAPLQDNLEIEQKKVKLLFTTMDKFLANLEKDPSKEVIRWPDRAKKIKEFRKKLKDIAGE